MKVLKVIFFLALVAYWVSTMNDKIKGEGLFGSFLGIAVLLAFIYGAYELIFNRSKKENNNNEEISKSINTEPNNIKKSRIEGYDAGEAYDDEDDEEYDDEDDEEYDDEDDEEYDDEDDEEYDDEDDEEYDDEDDEEYDDEDDEEYDYEDDEEYDDDLDDDFNEYEEDNEIQEVVGIIKDLLLDTGKECLQKGMTINDTYIEMEEHAESIIKSADAKNGYKNESNNILTYTALKKAKTQISSLYDNKKENNPINIASKIGLHSLIEEQLYSLATEAVKESTINEKGMLMTYASQVVESLGNQSIETLTENKSELKLTEDDIEELVQKVAEEVRDRIVDEIKAREL